MPRRLDLRDSGVFCFCKAFWAFAKKLEPSRETVFCFAQLYCDMLKARPFQVATAIALRPGYAVSLNGQDKKTGGKTRLKRKVSLRK